MSFIITILVVMAAAVIGTGSVYFLKYKDDNRLEELCEDIIELQIGKKIDLSPESDELDDDNSWIIGEEIGEEDGNE